MDGIQEVTYQQLADRTFNLLKANCLNIGTDRLDARCKNGYAPSKSVGGGPGTTVTANFTLRNSVSGVVSEATVKNELNAYLNNVLLISAYKNQKINDANIFRYVIDLGIFCAVRTGIICSSNLDGGGVVNLVYLTGSKNYDYLPLDLENITGPIPALYTVSEIDVCLTKFMTNFSSTANRVVSNYFDINLHI